MGDNQHDTDQQADLDEPDTVDSLIAAVAHAPARELAELGELATAAARGGQVQLGPVEARGSAREQSNGPDVGTMIDGRYLLERVLGAGGMGVVYAARNVHTNKKVALKYLVVAHHPRQPSEERAARLLREARAAGRVRHPNVVDMIDVGGDPKQPYLVMELLDGSSLWTRMKASEGAGLPLEEVLPVMLGAMRGVAEAHRQGVIHRDLKPENIFLARAGDGTITPKVLDFGVSRIAHSAGETRSATLTRTGFVVGTPSYMPLEQLRGREDVDARADIYALGVVLYEALSGQRPFDATNEHDLGIRMATEKPTPLSKHLPNVDPRLEAAVMRALAREPKDRYPSVEAFSAALEHYRAQPLLRRRHLLLAACAGLTAITISFWLWRTQASFPAPIAPARVEITAAPSAVAAPAASEAPSRSAQVPARAKQGEPAAARRPDSEPSSTTAPLAPAPVPPASPSPAASRRARASIVSATPAAETTSSAPPPVKRATKLLPQDF